MSDDATVHLQRLLDDARATLALIEEAGSADALTAGARYEAVLLCCAMSESVRHAQAALVATIPPRAPVATPVTAVTEATEPKSPCYRLTTYEFATVEDARRAARARMKAMGHTPGRWHGAWTSMGREMLYNHQLECTACRIYAQESTQFSYGERPRIACVHISGQALHYRCGAPYDCYTEPEVWDPEGATHD
jgi:hypothetical protein